MDETLLYYEKNANLLAEKYHSANVDNLHSLLINTFMPNSYLLEIGCGSGRDTSFMYKNGYDIVAIDGSQKMISVVQKSYPELLNRLKVVRVPEQMNFSPSSFDGIYSIATLMHMDEDSIIETIEKVAKYLKPNSNFLFSVSIERDDIDKKGKDKQGRYFSIIPKSKWIEYCEKYNLYHQYSEINTDGLNRDKIVWFTCIVKKGDKY